jgi:acetylornithine/N-succinyldiaminopimelate aminotransferase
MTLNTGTATFDLDKEHHFGIYDRFPVIFTEGTGTRIKDSHGKEYIDFLAGIAVNNLGHCHPRVVDAIRAQAGKLIHISNYYYNEPQTELAELISKITGLDKVFFCNSGAEAVEGALKLARKFAFERGKRGKIVCMTNCFHGRTLATIAMGKKRYQQGFGPLPGGFIKMEFNDVDALVNYDFSNTIAVILETVQGEGGVYPADREFLLNIREICDREGALLILDEIQCGFGRTGQMFAYQHYGILPDILALAKALGGGVPIGAVAAKREIADAFQFGDHGTTFGGNPLASAAALAAVNAIINENCVDNSKEKGDYFRKKLKDLAQKSENIVEVRGIGLMIGLEIKPNAKDVVKKMFQKGILVNNIGDNIIRFVPPLIVTQTEIDHVVQILDQALQEVAYAERY